jgi:4,5-DOPA dioxygenase extradiol
MEVVSVRSIFDPLVPAGAYDEFVKSAAPASASQRAWTPDDGALPALYLGHGAPPLLDDPEWMGQLAAWAHTLPKPRGILIVSAHWEAAPLMLSAPGAGTPLVYDFGGFAPRYYTLTYRTPDASALAREVASLMPGTSPVHQHPSRGLDHGAWVPLKVMYPLADVPALQLSLPTQDPARLLGLGARLRPLREAGVLIAGSGFLTHGLPFVTREMIRRRGPGLVGRLRPVGRRGPGPRGHRGAGRLPEGARHAVRAPDGGPLPAAVRHARRRQRPVSAGGDGHRRLLDGLRQALVPGALSGRPRFSVTTRGSCALASSASSARRTGAASRGRGALRAGEDVYGHAGLSSSARPSRGQPSAAPPCLAGR